MSKRRVGRVGVETVRMRRQFGATSQQVLKRS